MARLLQCFEIHSIVGVNDASIYRVSHVDNCGLPIKNPVFATMVMIGITVLGVFSYNRLRVEQMPDVSLPFVQIMTSYPGAAPGSSRPTSRSRSNTRSTPGVGRQADLLELARGIEPGLRRVPPVDQRARRRSRTSATRSRWCGPAFRATSRIRSSIASSNENTRSRSRRSPFCRRRLDLRELTSLTDQTIVKALENQPGVARIDVNGRVTRQVLIQIKPNALTALGIGVDQVITAIQNANQDVPAGRLTRGQSDSVVRVEGKIKDPEQFNRIIVAQQGGGPVYLSQVADVIDGEKEMTSFARDQRPAGDHARHPEGAGR